MCVCVCGGGGGGGGGRGAEVSNESPSESAPPLPALSCVLQGSILILMFDLSPI